MTRALRRARITLVGAAVLFLPHDIVFLREAQSSLGLAVAGSLGISMAFIVLARLASRHPEPSLMGGVCLCWGLKVGWAICDPRTVTVLLLPGLFTLLMILAVSAERRALRVREVFE